MSELKKRNWCTEIYPDSAPEDFVDIIESWHIPCILSPLHAPDKETDFDRTVKPHFHLIIAFDGPIPESQVQELSDMLSGVKVFPVKSYRSYVRYLVHLDQPEKEQFPNVLPLSFGGADLSPILVDSAEDYEYNEIYNLICYCEEHCIVEFAELVHLCYIDKDFKNRYFRFLINRHYFVKSYLDSARNSNFKHLEEK